MHDTHKKRPVRLILGAIALTALLPATAIAGKWGDEYFKMADTNSDGALSKEEMSAARMKRMENADADKDGFISASELTEHHAARMRANEEKHFTRFSERFDADKDGKVSVEEIKKFEPPYFAKADANGDGKLTKEEMKAAMGEHHMGKHHMGKDKAMPDGDADGE
jgi:Ca2+-binding EF-hand superfamily protein